MALILKRLYNSYNWFFQDLADPRPVELNLFLMSSPLKPVLILLAYLYFIYNLGPRFMQNRKPFNLKIVLIAYNVIQILLNAYIVWEASIEVLYYTDWHCAPIDYSYSARALHVLKIYHLFFLIKMADLLDTVFFVLRKRSRQISFLHAYHHSGMFIMLWIVVKFFGGGAGVFTGLINAGVHSVMYTYYLLTALDEKWKDSVTFKRTITQIQIIQFGLFISIYGRLLFLPNCAYPKLVSYFFVPQNIFMVLLFADFYRKAYLSNKKSREVPKKLQQNGKSL